MLNSGYYYGIVSAIFWAISGTLYSLISKDSGIKSIYVILFFLLISDFFSLLFTTGVILKNKDTFHIKKHKKSIILALLSGIIGGSLGMYCYLMSIHFLGANYAIPISSTFPIFSVIMSYFFLKDKISFIGIIGFIISVLSSVLLYFDNKNNIFNEIGLIYVSLCVISWSLEVIFSSYSMKFISETLTYFIRLISSCLSYIVLLFIILKASLINIIASLTYNDIFYLFLIIISTFLSYFLYYKAIYIIGTIRAISINITYSIWTIIISYLFIKKDININLILCCIGILVGTLITLYAKGIKK